MANTSFAPVNNTPCPVCDKPDWCQPNENQKSVDAEWQKQIDEVAAFLRQYIIVK